jgi:hypothetical protein
MAARTAEICRKNDEKRRKKNVGKTRRKPAAPIAGNPAGMEAVTSGPTGNAVRNRMAVPETPANGRKAANTPVKRRKTFRKRRNSNRKKRRQF